MSPSKEMKLHQYIFVVLSIRLEYMENHARFPIQYISTSLFTIFYIILVYNTLIVGLLLSKIPHHLNA